MKRIFQDTWFDEWFVRKEEILHERFIDYAWTIQHIPTKPKAILDVGCGASYLPLLLSTFGHSVTALDSHNMDFGFPQYKFVQADALTAEFEHTFDYIIMLSSLEHIGVMDEKDPYKDIKTIENLARFLRPRYGKFIVTVPFGQPVTLNGWRVYDLKRLTSMFSIIELDCFMRDHPPFWRKVPVYEALATEHVQGEPSPATVCLLAGKK